MKTKKKHVLPEVAKWATSVPCRKRRRGGRGRPRHHLAPNLPRCSLSPPLPLIWSSYTSILGDIFFWAGVLWASFALRVPFQEPIISDTQCGSCIPAKPCLDRALLELSTRLVAHAPVFKAHRRVHYSIQGSRAFQDL